MPSEDKSGYMQQLDQWTQSVVIDPLYEDWRDVENAPDSAVEDECQQHLLKTVAEIKKAIREKVLESYRNGQKAGPYKPKPKQK
jgi:hypothetical protein